MEAGYRVDLPGGIVLTVEMKDRPVDFEIFVPGAGRIVFHRDQGSWPAVKGSIDQGVIPAAKRMTHKRPDGKVDKHEVFTVSGESVAFSDPEM